MKRVLVAGAGGGIGAALVDELSAQPGVERVYAVHRNRASSTHPKIAWLHADLADPDDLAALAEHIDEPLDGLIVASGLLHDADARPEKSLRDLDARRLMKLYETNAVAPLLALQTLQGCLRRDTHARVCLLSAQVGSIADNRSGGWYGYRMAKAALNMAVKCAAIELGRRRWPAIVVAVHPGTTRTALSARFVRRRHSVRTPRETAQRLLSLLSALGPEDSGSFLTADGAQLPW